MSVTVDEAKVEQFVMRALGDASAMQTVLFCALGDRLGLFKDLASTGAGTSVEIAKRTGLNERYIREWAGGLVNAGYLDYDAKQQTFSLPAENAVVLAEEDSPVFFGGMYSMFPSIANVFGQVEEAFRKGGGAPQSAYPDAFYDDMFRFTSAWFEHHLVQEWLPLVPDVVAKLNAGASLADVGCGRGLALIKLAQAFPKASFAGYDIYGPNVIAANERIKAAGLSNRIRIEERDVSKGLDDTFDIVTTFDVIHDAIDPRGLLRVIREGLKPGGTYLCLDINCSDKLEENNGPLGTLFHGFSVFYCMTTSLANGGEGLGTLGLNPKKLNELGTEAGFSAIEQVPLGDPFNTLFTLKA